MDRDQRQLQITKEMNQGMSFQAVYKESDGIPSFHFWIYEQNKESYMTPWITKPTLNKLLATLTPGTTYSRCDLLGYQITD